MQESQHSTEDAGHGAADTANVAHDDDAAIRTTAHPPVEEHTAAANAATIAQAVTAAGLATADTAASLPERRVTTLDGEIVTHPPAGVAAPTRTIVVPAGQPLPEVAGDTVIVIAKKPRWRRTRRLFRNLGAVLGLFILGGLVLAVIGDEGVRATQAFVDRVWWPATALRFLAYAVICTVLLPLFDKRIRNKAAANLAERRAALFAQDSFDAAEIARQEALERRLSEFRIPKLTLFILLVVFDLLALQLPFLLH
ncbi:MAG: hypothetical protein D8H94_04005 [Cardiobacterium sp.]|nr:MAG: hypothetical protein D8H94_04005 [Cardiobacterium sp.]